jgi:hypothetical protein
MHRTNTGRVVYDRKKHPFNLRDVHRIVRSIFLDSELDDHDQKYVVLIRSYFIGEGDAYLSKEVIDAIMGNFDVVVFLLRRIYEKVTGLDIDSEKEPTTLDKIQDAIDATKDTLSGDLGAGVEYIIETIGEIGEMIGEIPQKETNIIEENEGVENG